MDLGEKSDYVNYLVDWPCANDNYIPKGVGIIIVVFSSKGFSNTHNRGSGSFFLTDLSSQRFRTI